MTLTQAKQYVDEHQCNCKCTCKCTCDTDHPTYVEAVTVCLQAAIDQAGDSNPLDPAVVMQRLLDVNVNAIQTHKMATVIDSAFRMLGIE